MSILTTKEQKDFVNIQDYEGRTALHYAVCNGSRANVTFLLSKGADVNITDIHRNTALDYARYNNRNDLISLLESHLKKTGDKNNNPRDNNKQNRPGELQGQNPLHVQASNNEEEATKSRLPVRSSSLRSDNKVLFVKRINRERNSSIEELAN